MNQALEHVARDIGLDLPAHARLRFAFALACAERVRHLLEDARVLACLDGLGAWLRGESSDAQLQALAIEAATLANRHPGSRSLDGVGHAAVSASYAVAKALAGQALAAADYAAYAVVYAQGGAPAVAEPAAFSTEFQWQARCLADLATSETPWEPSQ